MILAAGRGTRLRPLTNDRPKALVMAGGVPLLELAIRRLIHFGCRDIIVNVHHFGEQIIEFLQEKDSFGINIQISDEREQLLDTGGALKKAADFFADGQPFLLYNTDIITDLHLADFYQQHCHLGALATLAVRWRPTSRYLIFDAAGLLHGWVNVNTGSLKMARPTSGSLQLLAFGGLHVIDPRLFAYLSDKTVFSIIDTYLEAAAHADIRAQIHETGTWMDVGKPANLEAAQPLAAQLLAECRGI